MRERGSVPLGIGENTVIKQAILDKNVRIGQNCQLINVDGVQRREDNGLYCIEDGIIVVRFAVTIPDGTII